jgi:hypothetical protein
VSNISVSESVSQLCCSVFAKNCLHSAGNGRMSCVPPHQYSLAPLQDGQEVKRFHWTAFLSPEFSLDSCGVQKDLLVFTKSQFLM